MKISTTERSAQVSKLLDAPDIARLQVNEGILTVSTRTRSVCVPNFLLFSGQEWYAGVGLHHATSGGDETPHEVALITSRKALVFDSDGGAELCTRKKPASPDALFLLIAALGNSVEVAYYDTRADGFFHHFAMANVEGVLELLYGLAVGAFAQHSDPKKVDSVRAFLWGGECE